MENNRELAKRFSDVILNNSWVANNSYKNQLIDLPLEVVFFKYQSLHSIAALAQHVHYYIAGILNVFNGGNLDIKDIYSFDFPPINTIEQWHTFLAVFWTDAASFTQKLEEMDEMVESILLSAQECSPGNNDSSIRNTISPMANTPS